MSVENQGRGLEQPLELEGTLKEEVNRRAKTVYTREFLLSCAELDNCKQFPAGFDPSVFRLSKTAYTREFLLSCAGLDACKQLPKGFDTSVLLELGNGFKGILEPWKGSGVLFLPNSGNNRCRAQFTGLCSNGSSWESVGRSDYLSSKWRRESNSQGNYHSDFKRHDDLTQGIVEVSACQAKDMGKSIQETEKTDHYQLSKSENPYRPPHTYQDGKKNYVEKSLSKETVAIEKADCGIQEERQLERHIIAEEKQCDSKDATFLAEENSSGPLDFVKPSCYDFSILEPNVTSDDEIIQFDSKKENKSPILGELNEEQYRMILSEDLASSLNVPRGCSCSVIENSMSQSLAANSECEKECFGETFFPIMKDVCSVLRSSSEANTVYSEMNQSHKPISEMEFNELLSHREFYSVKRGPFNRTLRDEVSEPYEFPFTVSYDLFTSVLREHNPIRTNHHRTIPADAGDHIVLYDIEENECTFDDMWSEILEFLHFEWEMDLTSAAESDQTGDFELQISFPDEDSLISIDNPTSTEHSKVVPLNTSNDIAHYGTEIHWPDENSLITIDDPIAPEDSLISIDYPTSAELSKFVHLDSSDVAADYDAEIHLPDEKSLITIDDLITFHNLKFIANSGSARDDTWISNVTDEVARQPGALVIADPAKRSATQGLEVTSSLDMPAPMAQQEIQLHFWQSSRHNPCTGIIPDMPVCYPFSSLEAQMRLHWYPCPNMVHQFPGKAASPKLKEFGYPLARYSLLQQPAGHLPIKDMASSIWELERTQLFPLKRQYTAYPDLAIADSGFASCG